LLSHDEELTMDSITAAAAAAIPVTQADLAPAAPDYVVTLRLAGLLARAAHGHHSGRHAKPHQAEWYRQLEDGLAQWLAAGGFQGGAGGPK
jgi:hypothetical protein